MMSPASTIISLFLAGTATTVIASPISSRQFFDGLDGLGGGDSLWPSSGGLGSGGWPSSGGGSGGGLAAGGSSTRDDFKDSGCKPTVVIFARGTGEMGNVGTVTGPPFFEALTSKLGGEDKVAVQGVDYAASWSTVAGGDPAGIETMANLVKQVANKCGDSNIVMSGYSQGAELVHNAAKSLSSDVLSHVSSAVNFGDPYNGQEVQGVPNSLSICFSDDSVCNMAGPSEGTGSHLGYSAKADEAAAFVAKNNH